jgi:5-methylcytosine-specific restriction endonuclease McrA
MGMGTATRLDVLTCARCGQQRPVGEFERRYVDKGCRVTCGTCRGLRRERQRVREAAAQAAAAEEQERWERWKREWEERERAREERERPYRARAAALGFDEREQGLVCGIHEMIRDRGVSWAETKRRFIALTPPYVRERGSRRYEVARSIRHAIYAAQEGCCAYCGRQIDVQGAPGTVACPCENCRHRRGDTAPSAMFFHCRRGELDHRTPRCRGGGDERANLWYACTECNQRKHTRTAEEFARYPDDPVTQIGVSLAGIAGALELEARGYAFDDAAGVGCA